MTAKKTTTVDTTNVPATPNPALIDPALAKPDDLTAATDVAASGALVEPEIPARIDTAHPAVDDEPRKHATKASNQIDFNDPTLSTEEAVIKSLGAQN